MRTRALKRNVHKQVKKEAKKSIKTLINEFHSCFFIVTGKQIGRASCRERVSSPV